eukprot:CAMPEP_0175597512 /NCGR_PEP_ID=MMETSP0096-20121207/56075_1 /TAXON_ID=311494 /ORGANISM="Alexandrium monilatum, Strain CCMP3105" /LENGTH=53 /DNA_ID=CAMNT_0016901987 /DNA_START=241 /DNA_END=399 /DNA_ORIENTATION=-
MAEGIQHGVVRVHLVPVAEIHLGRPALGCAEIGRREGAALVPLADPALGVVAE